VATPKARRKAASPWIQATAAAPRVRGGIPNGLTLAGLALGFLASLAAGKGDLDQALSLLAMAAMADALAGWAAQGLRLATPIGAELDSLASLVVWGVAVALLAYAQCLQGLGPLGLGLAGLAAVSAAWRLCRGDGQNARERYEGLPLPAAGAVLAAALALGCPAPWLALLVAVLAVAQVGPWSYPRIRPGLIWFLPVFLSLGAAAVGWRPGWALPGVVAAGYAVFAPLYVRVRAARA
jgi:CDP-diacylglycerol--serine O-phosphatidyltransferase